jgi:hypothetical protein
MEVTDKKWTLNSDCANVYYNQVISDFGFGEQRKAREEFVASFSMVYHLKQMRVMGEDVRLLKCYPGKWQVSPPVHYCGTICSFTSIHGTL